MFARASSGIFYRPGLESSEYNIVLLFHAPTKPADTATSISSFDGIYLRQRSPARNVPKIKIEIANLNSRCEDYRRPANLRA